ncbi:hypothetical protein JCM39068_41490 [Desulfocastanea catecholica]
MNINNCDIDSQPKEWVIFVINHLKDRKSRNSYQRIVALSQKYRVVVVTNNQLPQDLEVLVSRVCVELKKSQMVLTAVNIARQLIREDKKVYVHTEYSPNSALVGYLCKKRTGCKWVYDLYDHPSVGWIGLKGPSLWFRQTFWWFFSIWILAKADAWIIAMHPAILGCFPPAPVNCQIIFIRAGYINVSNNIGSISEKNRSSNVVKIAYAGPIMRQRGLYLLKEWAESYDGSFVELHLIGPCVGASSVILLNELSLSCDKKANISLKVWGELPHSKTLEILKDANIGICPLDTTVLNYKYAFPVKVIEYMSLGLIVVATESHGTRELIVDGENGITARDGCDGFNKALNKAIAVYKNHAISELMRKACRKTVAEHSWHNVNKNLLYSIKRVLRY